VIAVLVNDDLDYVFADDNGNHMTKGSRNINQEESYVSLTGRWLPTARYPVAALDRREFPFAFWVASADYN
jgi:hypothetical protein